MNGTITTKPLNLHFMAKLTNISGFPEWLPSERIAEEEIIERIKGIYRSYGYLPIETPAAELLSTLGAKGVIDKELYALKRVQDNGDDEAELALHFDLTVPFARYVAQHFNDLIFPFKRYQVQKVWRGDRPQKGRFREFYQFDIDVIARDDLPLSSDAEVITMLDRAFSALNLGEHKIKLNNRKILLGFYNSLGLSEEKQKKAITVVDKIDKIGPDKVQLELTSTLGLASDTASKIVELTKIKVPGSEAGAKLAELGISDPQFLEGSNEVARVLELLPRLTQDKVVVDLSLARGLDYYTGAIFEVVYPAYPEFGSLGSGGRYDDLASDFINKKLPGVGASLGLTRAMDLGLRNKLISAEKKGYARALVSVYAEEQRAECNRIAEILREHGVSTEVFYKSPKIGKQIEYAESKGMQFVFFLDSASGKIEVKDLTKRVQQGVQDLVVWCKSI